MKFSEAVEIFSKKRKSIFYEFWIFKIISNDLKQLFVSVHLLNARKTSQWVIQIIYFQENSWNPEGIICLARTQSFPKN